MALEFLNESLSYFIVAVIAAVGKVARYDYDVRAKLRRIADKIRCNSITFATLV